MPETARILEFPARKAQSFSSREEAKAIAREYLGTPRTDRGSEFVDQCLREPEVVLALCSTLRELRDTSPSSVAEEAALVYGWMHRASGAIGLFDERYYFLGESALLAGVACRLLGKREDAELWLDRAEASFRHTVNPAPMMASVSYARLSLLYSVGQYSRVLEMLPSLALSFQQAGMKTELLKCRFLEAMTLKDSGRSEEALQELRNLRTEAHLENEPALLARVLMTLGEVLAGKGLYQECISLLNEALPLLENGSQQIARAQLKVILGEALRNEGHLFEAAKAYRAAIKEYAALEMVTFVAYLRVILAETLIASTCNREAEWEILAALPTIEEQRMVPEGFAAVALLRESVRLREADPNALRELREHLQANR